MEFYILSPTCPIRATRFWRTALKKVASLATNTLYTHLGLLGQLKKYKLYTLLSRTQNI